MLKTTSKVQQIQFCKTLLSTSQSGSTKKSCGDLNLKDDGITKITLGKLVPCTYKCMPYANHL
jgi:hypothetical protein